MFNVSNIAWICEPTACAPIKQHPTSRITWCRDGVPEHPVAALLTPSGKCNVNCEKHQHILHTPQLPARSGSQSPTSSQLPHTPFSPGLHETLHHWDVFVCHTNKQRKCPGLNMSFAILWVFLYCLLIVFGPHSESSRFSYNQASAVSINILLLTPENTIFQ